MNALVTKSVVQQAMSVLTDAAPSNLAKTFCGRLPVSSPRAYRAFHTAAFSASAPLETYQQPHQNVTHFPELVSAFGERTFTACWH